MGIVVLICVILLFSILPSLVMMLCKHAAKSSRDKRAAKAPEQHNEYKCESVTSRIKSIEQPKGGYLSVRKFEKIDIDDGLILNDVENIHASIVGLVVDYMSRYMAGSSLEESFGVSLLGAMVAESFGVKGALHTAKRLLDGITGIDDNSIINACKLVTFDVWYRSTAKAMTAKTFRDVNPDKATVENVQIMIRRSLVFFQKYGPVTSNGFTFEPPNADENTRKQWMESTQCDYGGYTKIVASGDGDFLTKDTLWDFKVSKSSPTTKHTLQILMYWIMGQHSGQDVYKGITSIGFFNPRLNRVYLLPVNKIDIAVIKAVEDDVICYKQNE